MLETSAEMQCLAGMAGPGQNAGTSFRCTDPTSLFVPPVQDLKLSSKVLGYGQMP